MHACVLSHFSLVQLFAGLRTVVRQTPLSIGFSSQEYRGSSWLEINPHHLRLLHCRQILHPWATGEALAICKDAVNPLPEDGSCRRRSQWKTLNQAFSLCIQSPSYALTQPHGSNTEARQHSGLCWFPEASRNPHPEVETGASFKCLAGSCSRRLNPGALQSAHWVACSVIPRVEVTIPHCKDQSNKKKYVFTYAQDFTFLSIFLHLQLLTWKISPREDFKTQHSTRKTWGRKPSQENL